MSEHLAYNHFKKNIKTSHLFMQKRQKGPKTLFANKPMFSDGHDKPFCAKAITIIDNSKKALGDTDN